MLTIEGVSKRYRAGNYGVRDVSLSLRAGVIGLLGPNGAGKTTLMQLIATITRPTAGRILFHDTDIAKRPDELRRKLGFLPQDFGVYDNLTALEFLSYFAALKGVRERSRIMRMLELVNLHHVSNRAVGGFSGGMKQRLGIAQALINDPEVVVVDEPTAGLDPEERVRFRNVLSEIGFGKLVILSTHIVADIESIATEIAVMREGRVVLTGTPEELLRSSVGNVWQLVASSEEYEKARTSMAISSAVRRPDGVHLRVIADRQPSHDAVSIEPTLEDAYLFTMKRGAA